MYNKIAFKKLIKLSIILFSGILFLMASIHISFDIFLKKSSASKYKSEFWSHRGILFDSIKENSIAAFEIAVNKGLTGIETDVFWIDSLQKCVVMHDYDSSSLRHSPLFLEDILYRFKDSINYWIDFKNLTNNNVNFVKKYLEHTIQKTSTQNHLFVESGNGLVLRKLDSKNINTLYWIQYNRSNFIIKNIKLLYTKALILLSDFDGYTIAYSYMDSDFKNNFTGLPIYLFHGNFKQYQTEIIKNPFIKVCLVDNDFF